MKANDMLISERCTSMGKGADPMDDAPQRSAVLLLFVIVPIAYPVLAASAFLLTSLLQKFHLLQKKVLAGIVLVLSTIFGILLGIQSPFGVKDQLIGVSVFFCCFAIAFGLGAITLWLLLTSEHNPGMQRIAEKTGSC
jgi:hypothetical protein